VVAEVPAEVIATTVQVAEVAAEVVATIREEAEAITTSDKAADVAAIMDKAYEVASASEKIEEKAPEVVKTQDAALDNETKAEDVNKNEEKTYDLLSTSQTKVEVNTSTKSAKVDSDSDSVCGYIVHKERPAGIELLFGTVAVDVFEFHDPHIRPINQYTECELSGPPPVSIIWKSMMRFLYENMFCQKPVDKLGLILHKIQFFGFTSLFIQAFYKIVFVVDYVERILAIIFHLLCCMGYLCVV